MRGNAARCRCVSGPFLNLAIQSQGRSAMKRGRIVLQTCAAVMFLFCLTAQTQDADKQKLIDIEKAFVSQQAAGPEMAAIVKQYLFEGPVDQLTPMGRIGSLPKARIVELSSKPDPTDPDAKSADTLSDFHIDLYGDTALVGYKQTNVDRDHKDQALNTTSHMGCLDTFVKRNGQWYVIGGACALSTPMTAAERAAINKAIAQEPKDVQQAYH
jgi:hypothetical protein